MARAVSDADHGIVVLQKGGAGKEQRLTARGEYERSQLQEDVTNRPEIMRRRHALACQRQRPGKTRPIACLRTVL